MAKKLNHYVITVEVAETYEVPLNAPSETRAVEMAKKLVKDQDVEADERVIDVIDVYESQNEENIED